MAANLNSYFNRMVCFIDDRNMCILDSHAVIAAAEKHVLASVSITIWWKLIMEGFSVSQSLAALGAF